MATERKITVHNDPDQDPGDVVFDTDGAPMLVRTNMGDGVYPEAWELRWIGPDGEPDDPHVMPGTLTLDEVLAEARRHLDRLDNLQKINENRLRRMAARQGLQLQKSRRRDPRAYDYGTYRLVDAHTNTVVAYAGPSGYGLSVGTVEDYLTGDKRQAGAR